jgi:putative transposase
VLVDGRGVPLAAAVDGANVHDQKLLIETLDTIPIERPEPTTRHKQHLCLDKGYAGEPVEREAAKRSYILHVPPKEGETVAAKHRRGKARRWKVERTHSWINRARRLLIRWEKKATNYVGFLQLQFAIVALRTAGVFG